MFAATEQLSRSLQGKDTTVQEAVTAAALCKTYLSSLWSDEKFNEFYQSVVDGAKDLTSAPQLPRYRTPARRAGDGAPAHRFASPEDCFRQEYFEVLDVLVLQLTERYEQRRGMPVAEKIEKILLSAVNANCCSVESIREDLAAYHKDVSFP